jgi:hypothetical protein
MAQTIAVNIRRRLSCCVLALIENFRAGARAREMLRGVLKILTQERRGDADKLISFGGELK